MAVARETGTPLTMRGAGTSIAGNAIGAGIVIDTSKHLNRVLVDRPRGAHRARAAGSGARRAAEAGRAARAAVRPGPVDAHPLHDRRDDRQQRLRLAGAGLRAHGRQRRGADGAAGRRDGRACLGVPRWFEEAEERAVSKPPDRCTERVGRRAPRHRAHGVRPVRSPGVGLLLRAPAARAGEAVRPVPGRHRGHPGGRPRRHRAPRRGRPGPGSRRARLPVDGRCGGRRTRPAGSTRSWPARGSTSASPGWSAAIPSCRRATAGCSPR